MELGAIPSSPLTELMATGQSMYSDTVPTSMSVPLFHWGVRLNVRNHANVTVRARVRVHVRDRVHACARVRAHVKHDHGHAKSCKMTSRCEKNVVEPVLLDKVY